METAVSIYNLMGQVEFELFRMGYRDRTIKRYRRVWNRLARYMEERSIEAYNAKVGLDFLDETYRITVFNKLSNEDKVRARSITVLNDFHLHGLIPPKCVTSSVSLLSYHTDILQKFKEHQMQFQISKSTLKSYEKHIGKFLLFLEKHNNLDLSQITAGVVLDYVDVFCGYTPATSYNSLCALRVFLRYLHSSCIVGEDLSEKVPHVSYRRDARIPSAFPKEDIKRILESVDRANPNGKRDYAILLLASKLGLRSGDIRNLTFSNFHWDKNIIELTMNKTGKEISLPLLESVGMAIIDYVKHGRPKADTDIIFLRHVSPIQKLTASSLTAIVKKYISIAVIDVKPGQSQGPHAMRHSLASALLEDNVPLPVISEILGHTDTRTTGIYLKIDVKQLKNCGLEVPNFDWNIGREVF